MANATIPLGMPQDLPDAVKRLANLTGLSDADVMRQSMKLGLPKLEERLSERPLTPMTPEECRQCWEEPDPEFDALAAHCANLQTPTSPPED